MAETTASLPVIDVSALTGDDSDRRSKTIHDLHQACQDWGFFILVNHGVPEDLMKATCTAIQEFFALPLEEKKYESNSTAIGPIQWANSHHSNPSNRAFSSLWRDYLTLYVHPEFHCPNNPQTLREVLPEYTEKMRTLARKLVEAVSEALELDQKSVDEVLNLDSGFQMLTSNLYPPCPQPDQAIGLPPHTDPGLFTLLIHNGVAGLQIEHNGNWVQVHSPQNSILVNVADQLEILSNGKCKSVKHRAVVNSEMERISIVASNGPAKEAMVGPAAALVEKDGRALYRGLNYGEYLDARVTGRRVEGKTLLEQMMIEPDIDN